MGKSSILNALRFEPEAIETGGQGDPCFVFVDCQYLAGATEEQVIQFLLDRLQLELDESPLPPQRASLGRAVQEILGGAPPRRPILLLDEVDVLAHSQTIPQDFFGFLRAWSQTFQIPLVTASKESSIESLVWNEKVGSPFWNIFKPLYVGPFTVDEALQVVRVPSRSQSVEFSTDEVDHVLAVAGYQPFFLQIACDYLFQAKVEGAEGAAALERLELGFRQEAAPHLDYLLRGLPEAERRGLADFVASQTVPEGRVRSQLLRKGVLVEDARGLRVFSRPLADRIREQAQLEPSTATLFDRVKARFLE
ncbi:MAG: hypothetical protein A3G25_13950 [Betaproteobacteria bacterium RIFCSPLOWO2_12_FULL_63_13]|nr:MAG: hypothetical protein A3G25_13950 [Betaproteobacteria bacterium RIFCSPLOWO2_12_FULL_63_13]